MIGRWIKYKIEKWLGITKESTLHGEDGKGGEWKMRILTTSETHEKMVQNVKDAFSRITGVDLRRRGGFCLSCRVKRPW